MAAELSNGSTEENIRASLKHSVHHKPMESHDSFRKKVDLFGHVEDEERREPITGLHKTGSPSKRLASTKPIEARQLATMSFYREIAEVGGKVEAGLLRGATAPAKVKARWAQVRMAHAATKVLKSTTLVDTSASCSLVGTNTISTQR